MRAIRVFGFAGQPGVGDDTRHGILELLGAAEQRNGVVVAFAHLAPVEAWQVATSSSITASGKVNSSLP